MAALPELDGPRLLQELGRPAGTLVSERSLEDFFALAIKGQPWHDASELAVVERYRALLHFLGTSLECARVFRVGAIEVEAFALGKTSEGQWLGVATTLIET